MQHPAKARRDTIAEGRFETRRRRVAQDLPGVEIGAGFENEALDTPGRAVPTASLLSNAPAETDAVFPLETLPYPRSRGMFRKSW